MSKTFEIAQPGNVKFVCKGRVAAIALTRAQVAWLDRNGIEFDGFCAFLRGTASVTLQAREWVTLHADYTIRNGRGEIRTKVSELYRGDLKGALKALTTVDPNEA